jgi:predicted transcriptional regulator
MDKAGAMEKSIARRAAAFKRVREAHRTELAEDYVELIGDLIAALGEARLTDLADHMGVTHATASKVVQRFWQKAGLVKAGHTGHLPHGAGERWRSNRASGTRSCTIS